LEFVGATELDPPPGYTEAAQRALGLMTRWDDRVHARLFGEQLPAQRVHKGLLRVHQAMGACTLKNPLLTTRTGMVYDLGCENGQASLHIRLSKPKDGKIRDFEIHPVGRTCG